MLAAQPQEMVVVFTMALKAVFQSATVPILSLRIAALKTFVQSIPSLPQDNKSAFLKYADFYLSSPWVDVVTYHRRLQLFSMFGRSKLIKTNNATERLHRTIDAELFNNKVNRAVTTLVEGTLTLFVERCNALDSPPPQYLFPSFERRKAEKGLQLKAAGLVHFLPNTSNDGYLVVESTTDPQVDMLKLRFTAPVTAASRLVFNAAAIAQVGLPHAKIKRKRKKCTTCMVNLFTMQGTCISAVYSGTPCKHLYATIAALMSGSPSVANLLTTVHNRTPVFPPSFHENPTEQAPIPVSSFSQSGVVPGSDLCSCEFHMNFI